MQWRSKFRAERTHILTVILRLPEPLSERSERNAAEDGEGSPVAAPVAGAAKSEYLVAWIAPRHEALGRIQGLRLRADGTAIDQQPFDLSPDSVAADIALIAVPEGFAIAYSRSDAANSGMLRASSARSTGCRRRRGGTRQAGERA